MSEEEILKRKKLLINEKRCASNEEENITKDNNYNLLNFNVVTTQSADAENTVAETNNEKTIHNKDKEYTFENIDKSNNNNNNNDNMITTNNNVIESVDDEKQKASKTHKEKKSGKKRRADNNDDVEEKKKVVKKNKKEDKKIELEEIHYDGNEINKLISLKDKKPSKGLLKYLSNCKGLKDRFLIYYVAYLFLFQKNLISIDNFFPTLKVEGVTLRAVKSLFYFITYMSSTHIVTRLINSTENCGIKEMDLMLSFYFGVKKPESLNLYEKNRINLNTLKTFHLIFDYGEKLINEYDKNYNYAVKIKYKFSKKANKIYSCMLMDYFNGIVNELPHNVRKSNRENQILQLILEKMQSQKKCLFEEMMFKFALMYCQLKMSAGGSVDYWYKDEARFKRLNKMLIECIKIDCPLNIFLEFIKKEHPNGKLLKFFNSRIGTEKVGNIRNTISETNDIKTRHSGDGIDNGDKDRQHSSCDEDRSL